jgi:hypothetical protein
MQAGLSGIIGEAFREMVSEKTYTALESRALQCKPTGGKLYGYGDGEPETVRQVFTWYAAGHSAQWIAAELNRQGIPPVLRGTAPAGVVVAGIRRPSGATRNAASAS